MKTLIRGWRRLNIFFIVFFLRHPRNLRIDLNHNGNCCNQDEIVRLSGDQCFWLVQMVHAVSPLALVGKNLELFQRLFVMDIVRAYFRIARERGNSQQLIGWLCHEWLRLFRLYYYVSPFTAFTC